MYRALVLAQEPNVPDPNGGDTGKDGGGGSPFGGLQMLVPFILILVLMYFIMLRPQRKQEKRRREMLSEMAKNDRVVTIGGIQGIIYSIDEGEVTLKVDERNDVRMTFAKSAIARVIRDEEAAGN